MQPIGALSLHGTCYKDVAGGYNNENKRPDTENCIVHGKQLVDSVEPGLYDTLEKCPQTASQVASELKLDQVKIYDFLDALLSMGYLERSGSGESATYRASESSRAYLRSSSNDYIGGMLIMSSKRLYRIWHDLPEALATGKAQSEVKESGKHLFETMYQDPEKLYDFCKAMQSLSRENFQAFVEKFDFTPTKSHLDIGGSLGVLSSKIKTTRASTATASIFQESPS